MQHRFCVEAVDCSLQDLLGNNKRFGGITVVLGGDFKQTLPIVTQGSREQIVCACLKRSFLWKDIKSLALVKNMRLNFDDIENLKFADYLLKVGTDPEETIQIPSEISRCQNTLDLLFKVYPNLNKDGITTEDYLRERIFLSARNDDVSILNALAINHFLGELHEYIGADQELESDEPIEERGYPVSNENMQVLDPPSLPPFKLQLKKGCPIMLLRNIQPKDGLCNGTRLMVLQFGMRVIEAQILTGSPNHVGKKIFIPRITLEPTDCDTPYKMSRRQFPIRLALAMTINKSQGQSVKYVGIDLQDPVFSHGQLYVALSRCTSMRRITVLLPSDNKDTTTNVVYP